MCKERFNRTIMCDIPQPYTHVTSYLTATVLNDYKCCLNTHLKEEDAHRSSVVACDVVGID